MARRKRKDDEADWVAPEFDEVSYMRREIEGARAAVVTIGWAVVGALVAFGLYSVSSALAFIGGIAVGFGLYFILPLLGIKTDSFKRRDWTGHGITYFFSWLAVWLILLNPPFGDFTDPSIQGISVSPTRSGYTLGLLCAVPGASVSIPATGNTSIYVLFRATDNVGLASLNVTVQPQSQALLYPTPTNVSGNSPCKGHQQEGLPTGSYDVVFPMTASSFQVSIVATDPSGRQARVGFQVFVV